MVGRNCKNTNSARNFCNTAVSGAVSVANTASGIAKGIAVQAQKDLTVAEKNLKIAAQDALGDIRKDLASIGDKIKCAASLGPGN